MRAGQVKCLSKFRISHSYLILFTSCFLFLTACSSSVDKGPSIVVVAVDSLPVNEISCDQELESSPRSGFNVLCREFVRFTHAFTPSVLSQPAVTSMLTGLYPFQHMVRSNVSENLNPEFQTVGEVAVQAGYRTVFFSGGAPIFRKSGLQKGFEIFEDNFNPSPKKLYRPFFRNVNLFKFWLDEIGRANPILSFFYVPDLSFHETETTNDYGELRTSSAEGQLEELSETLYSLIDGLKKQNRWDSTWFVLAGLNGRPIGSRREEWPSLNVLSENTRVALFIKPATRLKDGSIQLKSDTPVSLIDVGATLFEILSVPERLQPSNPEIEAKSLLPLVRGEIFDWPTNRVLISESGWALGIGKNIRHSARFANYLYVHDSRPLVFNTLTDRYEQISLPPGDPNRDEIYRKGMQFFSRLNIPQFTGLSANEFNKYSLGYLKWSQPGKKEELKSEIVDSTKVNSQDFDLWAWQARFALENRDWSLLKNAGEKTKNTIWSFVAKKNMPPNPKEPLDWPQEPCWHLFSQKKTLRSLYKSCENPLMLDLLVWVQSQNEEERDSARERFIRNYQLAYLDKKVFEANASLGWIWDINPTIPMGPISTDLILNLPEMERFRETVQKRSFQF